MISIGTTRVTPTLYKFFFCMAIDMTRLKVFTKNAAPTLSVTPLIFVTHFVTSSPLQFFWCCFIFLCPEWTVKLIHKDIILAQPNVDFLVAMVVPLTLRQTMFYSSTSQNLSILFFYSNRSHWYTSLLLAESKTLYYSYIAAWMPYGVTLVKISSFMIFHLSSDALEF